MNTLGKIRMKLGGIAGDTNRNRVLGAALVLCLLLCGCEGSSGRDTIKDGSGRYWTFYGDYVPGGMSHFGANLSGGDGDWTQVDVKLTDGSVVSFFATGESIDVDLSNIPGETISTITIAGSEGGIGTSTTWNTGN